ncbi:MAG: hypothetical protein ACE37H_15355 [Phycisphaeraceae bacterium]
MRSCSPSVCLVVCLGVVAGLMTGPVVARADPAPRPPAALAGLGVAGQGDERQAARRQMTWQQVVDAVEPAPPTEPAGVALVQADGPAVAALLVQADASIERGEVFGAIQLLREAEALAPDSAAVVRGLGVAYTQSGNRVRGAVYLRRVIASDPNDAGALVLLSQHAAERGDLPGLLVLSERLAEQGEGGRALSALYAARVLGRQGYSQAAADRMDRAFAALQTIDLDALAKQGDADAVVLRELRVFEALAPQHRIDQGDWLLASGQTESAARAYARVDLDRVADRAALVARRAYLSLRAGQNDQAIEQVVGLLTTDGSTKDDAALVGYLAAQGVPAAALADRLERAIRDEGGSLALLAGLAEAGQPKRTIAAVSAWLGERPADPALLRQAASLIDFDDADPKDAEPLAGLLRLTADQMRNDPTQARRFAEALVGEVDALVCLLRALKRPELKPNDDPYRALVVAVAYEHAGRLGDAIDAYRRAATLEPELAPATRLPLARLLVDAQRGEEALAVLLRSGGADAGWEHFALTVRAMTAIGDHDEAMQLIDAWLAQQGEVVRTMLLKAELLAEAGDPRRACEVLITLIRQNPMDERPYATGLRLIDRHFEQFGNLSAALNMRKAFLALLEKNLPDAPTTRIERAFEIYDDPDQARQAEQLLTGVLAEEPDNALALEMLLRVYEQAGEDEKAAPLRARLARLTPPGVARAMDRAVRAIGNGEMQAASQLLRNVLELDKEGVLPGPAMTGDDAASLLQLLGSAEPDADLEAYALAMVKRFPNNALLNNALGYQWTVQGKHLLQAKAMIARALEVGGDNHSVLDSMAWVQYKLGDFAQAEAYQRRAIEMLREEQLRRNEQLRASKAVLYDHMGDIMYKQGDTASAIRHWQIARAQRLDDEDLMFEPELRTLGDRVDKKIDAVREGVEPPVEPVPGKEAHGPAGHPADEGGEADADVKQPGPDQDLELGQGPAEG